MAQNNKKIEPMIKSWYIEDELSGNDQSKKDEIQKVCERLKIPFTKENAMAIIYGDTQILLERIPPVWLYELK